MSDVLQTQTGYDIVLSPSATGNIGYVLIFRTVDAGGSVLPREALAWQEMTMLLHLDAIATFAMKKLSARKFCVGDLQRGTDRPADRRSPSRHRRFA